MLLDTSRKERTGWRDEEISSRHRMWGFNCPARDVDFLMVESDNRKAVAIIDYKHISARDEEVHSREHEPVIWLADGRNIPFFVVTYDPVPWWFTVYAKNGSAEQFVDKWCNKNYPDQTGRIPFLTEYDYVKMLYDIRGRDFFSDRRIDITSLSGAANDNNPLQIAA